MSCYSIRPTTTSALPRGSFPILCSIDASAPTRTRTRSKHRATPTRRRSAAPRRASASRRSTTRRRRRGRRDAASLARLEQSGLILDTQRPLPITIVNRFCLCFGIHYEITPALPLKTIVAKISKLIKTLPSKLYAPP